MEDLENCAAIGLRMAIRDGWPWGAPGEWRHATPNHYVLLSERKTKVQVDSISDDSL